MKYTCIDIQGNLLSEETLNKIELETEEGQTAKDFGFEPGTNLRNEIEYTWSRIKLDWKHFSERSRKVSSTDPYGTTLSRKWMANFLSSFNFELVLQKNTLKGDNDQNYSISHTTSNLDDLPIHIVGFVEPAHPEKNTLDVRTSGGTTRLTPHGTMQEYINVTEHAYGVVTNGLYLRLIRDSGRLIKLTYIEFDLKRMLDEDKYSEFTILYRILHASRFPKTKQDAEHSFLERYYRVSIETGNRIREDLSVAVKESLVALGTGFLRHEKNDELRTLIKTGHLTPKNYYRQLLRIIYRLLFLMKTEERDLIYDPEDRSEEIKKFKKIYQKFYSISRLRNLSEKRYLYQPQFTDLWQGLLNTFLLFEAAGNGKTIGIRPLDGDLFHYNAIADLQTSFISNSLLLECIKDLNEFTDENGNLVAINYRSLDVEELGSVYEKLLDLHPIVENIESVNPAHIGFIFHGGTDRKTTGSYYTRPELVNELIKSALIPVIEEKLESNVGRPDLQLKALLKLKVCDAAAGSGHMLLAAARTIAWYLAKVTSGEENPSPSTYRKCLREVIQHCIYAVDQNPDAVELCKLALWLEGHNSGKPLSFLDHKIRCGNSLVGVTNLKVLEQPIPDEAYDSITGDSKATCKDLKKKNATFRKTKQIDLFSAQGQQIQKDKEALNQTYAEMESIEQDTVEAVMEVKARFKTVRKSVYHEENACNIWTAAYFKKYLDSEDPTNPTSEKLAQYFGSPTQYGRLVGEAAKLASEHRFFHWPLEFPDVFEQGGFDVMLGNPPWEKIQVEEVAFFSTRDLGIAKLTGDKRKKKIKELETTNPELFSEFLEHRRSIEANDKFIKSSNSYPLTGNGKMNTYAIFSELTSKLVCKSGRVGILVPLGIVTDDNNKLFFSKLNEEKRIISVAGFENEEFLFPDVHHSFKFVLLVISGLAEPTQYVQFIFFCRQVAHLNDPLRSYRLSPRDIVKLNPNTTTSPIFRTKVDADLNSKLYGKFPVIVQDHPAKNPWSVVINRMINPTDDSSSFLTAETFSEPVRRFGIKLSDDSHNYFPLYEAKMIFQYDHRFGTYLDQTDAQANQGKLPELTEHQHQDPEYLIEFSNYVPEEILSDFLLSKTQRKWLFAFRDITSAVVHTTAIACIIPKSGAVDPCRVIYFGDSIKSFNVACFLGMFNSKIFDYLARQKVSGNHLAIFILKQLPIIPPDQFTEQIILEINTRVVELVYQSWDIKSFIDDIWIESNSELRDRITIQWKENQVATGGHKWEPPIWSEDYGKSPENIDSCPLPPFRWNENRRAVLKAELDAIYANLYGLTTEELTYMLDPKEIYGDEFPGETFRVLKERELKLYGEYRTKRLILDAWENLEIEKKKITSAPSFTKQESLFSTGLTPMLEFNLNAGIYSVRDVSGITGFGEDKVRRWFRELAKANYEGLDGDGNADANKLKISFHGLIELVVIGTLRENNFSLAKILKARADLRTKTQKTYPFATNNVRDDLKVSGTNIIFQFPDSSIITLDGKGQYLLDVIKEFFSDIEFDTSGVALKLLPKKGKGKIAIDPKIGDGKPSVRDKGVWAETIASIYTGPDSIRIIKEQYDLEDDEILAAVEYCQ